MTLDRIQFFFARRSNAACHIWTRIFGLRTAFFVWVSSGPGVAHTFVFIEHIVLAMGVDSTSGITRRHCNRCTFMKHNFGVIFKQQIIRTTCAKNENCIRHCASAWTKRVARQYKDRYTYEACKGSWDRRRTTDCKRIRSSRDCSWPQYRRNGLDTFPCTVRQHKRWARRTDSRSSKRPYCKTLRQTGCQPILPHICTWVPAASLCTGRLGRKCTPRTLQRDNATLVVIVFGGLWRTGLTRHAFAEYRLDVTGTTPAPRGVFFRFAVRVPTARQETARVRARAFDARQLNGALVVRRTFGLRRFFSQA